jgi:DNA polymerase III epsilon subunit family exonuclease
VKIHGITPEMLAGQPPIAQVLPVFRAFVADTVLVAHNAAFDMRFLELKEAATGIRFDRPVLDTFLLSAVLFPNQETHRLEAIAERLGVSVMGRHTAVGDAIVTAEVFLKMLPLLAEKGIRTLGQAREPPARRPTMPASPTDAASPTRRRSISIRRCATCRWRRRWCVEPATVGARGAARHRCCAAPRWR